MQSKTAIVTGASKGIGKAIALKLATLNYNIVILSRSSNLLEELKPEIESLGNQCLPIVADLSIDGTPEKIIREVYSHFGQLDVLVNNAGLAYSGSIMETNKATWDELFGINVRAPFFLCKAAIPVLKQSSNPVIIN